MGTNPYTIPNQTLHPFQSNVADLLFKNKAFVKKIVEENISQDDTKYLLLYLCYENARFSAELLSELLWQVGAGALYCVVIYYSQCAPIGLCYYIWCSDWFLQIAYIYTYEMRPYLDMLLALLLMEDSWQTSRILNTLLGLDEDKEGLFDIIHKSKNNYQKRAYQCIKMMVNLLSKYVCT